MVSALYAITAYTVRQISVHVKFFALQYPVNESEQLSLSRHRGGIVPTPTSSRPIVNLLP